MALYGYDFNDIFLGLSVIPARLADKIGLQEKIEKQTGVSAMSYLSNRRDAYKLELALQEWVKENCKQLLDEIPYEEAKLTRDFAIEYAASSLLDHFFENEVGRDYAIAIGNMIFSDYSPNGLRQEFKKKGDARSTTDFSYLIDLV